MSAFAANLTSLARSKLHSGTSGSRDNLSLHRWVLLKNSITRDSYNPASSYDAPVHDVYQADDEDIVYEGVFPFLFPDPRDSLVDVQDAAASEVQWLDSLLESLQEDEPDSSEQVTIVPVSDRNQPPYQLTDRFPSHSISVPYSAPLSSAYTLQDSSLSDFPPSSPPYEPECPSLFMPDSIEDTSDDESDAPSSPFTNSRSSLSFVDPASIPLPSERTLEPRVYNESDDSMFNPFELDPLPNNDADANTRSLFSHYC